MAALAEAPPADTAAARNIKLYSVAEAKAWLKAEGLSRHKRVMMTGDREWRWPRVVREALMTYLVEGQVLIEGEARGADHIARMQATDMGIHVLGFPAPWGQRGRAAGAIRNQVMLAMRPKLVLAFHDDLKASKGTRAACMKAWDLGLPIALFDSRGSSQHFQRSRQLISFDELPVDYSR
jgi:hypothetical protein